MAVVNVYDANGWTNICQDRLLSTAQWRRLLGEACARSPGEPRSRLLDVGAGDGSVTQELAALFDEVVTPEPSTAPTSSNLERGSPGDRAAPASSRRRHCAVLRSRSWQMLVQPLAS